MKRPRVLDAKVPNMPLNQVTMSPADWAEVIRYVAELEVAVSVAEAALMGSMVEQERAPSEAEKKFVTTDQIEESWQKWVKFGPTPKREEYQ